MKYNSYIKIIILSQIIIDKKYWSRIKLNRETVDRYKHLYSTGKKLPPLIIQKDFFLVDGYHRLIALLELKFNKVEVIILDIPPEEILKVSTIMNTKNGLPLSTEEKRRIIKKLRFEQKLPLIEIADVIAMSYSRVHDVCEKLKKEYPNIDPDDIDLRYSEKKKLTRQSKPQNKKTGHMPIQLQIYAAKQRFKKLNPDGTEDDILWSDDFDPLASYLGNLHDLEEKYPQYRWFTDEEKFGDEFAEKPEWSSDNYYPLKLRLYQTASRWYYRATVYKKDQIYLVDRLPKKHKTNIPISEELHESQLEDDNSYFDEIIKSHYKEQAHELSRYWSYEKERIITVGDKLDEMLPEDIVQFVKEEERRQIPEDIRCLMN